MKTITSGVNISLNNTASKTTHGKPAKAPESAA